MISIVIRAVCQGISCSHEEFLQPLCIYIMPTEGFDQSARNRRLIRIFAELKCTILIFFMFPLLLFVRCDNNNHVNK